MSIQRLKITPVNTGDFSDNWFQAAAKIDANFVELYKNFTNQSVNAVVGGTTFIDANLGGYVQLLMGAGNTTIAFPTNTYNGIDMVFEIVQDGVGSRTVTWATGYVFTAATPPTLTLTANKRDLIFFTGGNGVLYGGQTILNLA